MKRKLVKQGAATMMISLPAKWIKQNKLDKGDEIDLEEKDRNLIISTEKIKGGTKEVVDISGMLPLVNRTIMSYYIKGVDELEVKFKEREEIQDFQKRVINELLGFEIIKQSQKSFLLKDIAGTELQDIDSIIKRLIFIIDSMIEELIEAIDNNQDIQPVIEIDSSINKFANFCLRMLNKKGYKKLDKTSQIYSVVSLLEEIGDLIKRIAISIENKEKVEKNNLNILKLIKQQINLFKQLFFNFEKKELINFAKNYEQIKSNIKGKTKIDLYLHELNDTIIRLNNHLLIISF